MWGHRLSEQHNHLPTLFTIKLPFADKGVTLCWTLERIKAEGTSSLSSRHPLSKKFTVFVLKPQTFIFYQFYLFFKINIVYSTFISWPKELYFPKIWSSWSSPGNRWYGHPNLNSNILIPKGKKYNFKLWWKKHDKIFLFFLLHSRLHNRIRRWLK